MDLSTHVEQVSVSNANSAVDGVLWLPDDPVGVILLADGRSGYQGKPPIDYVGTVLRNARLGTFWLDLSPQGEADPASDDPEVLVRQLQAACDWLTDHHAMRDVPVGLFGAGIGVAAVLQLAAQLGSRVFAVVLRGGRADFASQGDIPQVNAPTLLIAGSLDERVVGINRAIYAALRCKKRFEIIPGATHTFDEPGSLEVVARLTRAWYLQNMRAPGTRKAL